MDFFFGLFLFLTRINPLSNSFDKLLNEFPRLRYNFKNLVKTHYGYNILKEHRIEEPPSNRPILFTF